MKTLMSKEIINGVYQLVQTITYSNGTKVKRYGFDKNGVPQYIKEIKKS